ncbi:hypothetical protein [Microlunatus parietis]|uniref:Cellulose synthase n=1 Tax=Microlunatus parietis TaxID=682979 RepID=A0A7Y9I3Q6_9ACTN|nr:hypothetical protein [Microlunatus parietis]NYE69667.1 hypothetical protein [Microlunatus parietis]
MPASDAVLLPLCAGIALLGVIITALAWRRGNKGRVVQGIGVVLAPIALYFAGLLTLVWNAIVAVVGWAARIVFTPLVWLGISMLGLCIVLWVVGGIVAGRTSGKTKTDDGAKPVTGGQPKAVGGAKPAPKQQKQAAPAKQDPVDDDLAEIEALLKKRGIE